MGLFLPTLPRTTGATASLLVCLGLCFGVFATPSAAAFDPAVDQYSEHVPGAGGGKPTGKIDFGRKDSKLPPRTRKALERSGSDGKAVDALVALARQTGSVSAGSETATTATGTATGGMGGREAGASGGGKAGAPRSGATLSRDDSSLSPIEATVDGLTGGGLGAAFFVILILTGLLTLVLLLLRVLRRDRNG